MNTYEIFGKSGWVYIGKSRRDLEKIIGLYRILKKSIKLSECVLIHPVRDKNTSLEGFLNRPELLIDTYKRTDKDIKRTYEISANSIESFLKLD